MAVHHGSTIICTTAAMYALVQSTELGAFMLAIIDTVGSNDWIRVFVSFWNNTHDHDGMNIIIFFSSWTMRTGRHACAFNNILRQHWSARKPVFNHHENSKKMNKDRWFRKQTSRNKEQKKKTSLALSNLAHFL